MSIMFPILPWVFRVLGEETKIASSFIVMVGCWWSYISVTDGTDIRCNRVKHTTKTPSAHCLFCGDRFLCLYIQGCVY